MGRYGEEEVREVKDDHLNEHGKKLVQWLRENMGAAEIQW